MRVGLVFLIGVSIAVAAGADDSLEKRRLYLERMQTMFPQSDEWNEWLEESGELPPDFEATPSVAGLPDPLLKSGPDEGEQITTVEGWEAHRPHLEEQLQHWILGTVPPAPGNLEATVLEETSGTNAVSRELELRFGPGHEATLWCEVMIPEGDGPFPVFMTQHNHRAWALIALRRGYISVVYAGSDSRDDTDTFIDVYPDYDWSKLMRRAWASGRCIDYLEQSVPQANLDQIVLTGHSRNGKLSLMASAFEPRIDAVISSSSGAGGVLTSRFCSEQHFEEGIELITRRFPDWFHPRWRFFTGREDKCPVDLHTLVALSAPRPTLLSIAINDGVESSWAMQHTYNAVKPVYELYGAEDNLRIMWRPAGHETWPTVIEWFLDWSDAKFGRGGKDVAERYIFPWDWDGWRKKAGEVELAPERSFENVLQLADGSPLTGGNLSKKKEEVRAAVDEIVGTPPPGLPAPKMSYGEEPLHIEQMVRRDDAPGRVEKVDLVFGEYLNADVYVPKEAIEDDLKVPVVLWMHPYSFSHGYVAAYARGEQSFNTIVREDYAVFCFDQIGQGRRVEEAEGFYEDHPDWSLLGKYIRDTQAALDVMEDLPFIDTERIYVVGYAMGAFAALHVAALDERPDAVALVCGPAPFRLDTAVKGTGGMKKWAQWTMMAPRLGLYDSHENRTPYDVPELMACIAPRPLLVVSPLLDREARIGDVTMGVNKAFSAYEAAGAPDAIRQEIPEMYNHFDPRVQKVVLEWLAELAPEPLAQP